jgi:hypothetical protein
MFRERFAVDDQAILGAVVDGVGIAGCALGCRSGLGRWGARRFGPGKPGPYRGVAVWGGSEWRGGALADLRGG